MGVIFLIILILALIIPLEIAIGLIWRKKRRAKKKAKKQNELIEDKTETPLVGPRVIENEDGSYKVEDRSEPPEMPKVETAAPEKKPDVEILYKPKEKIVKGLIITSERPTGHFILGTINVLPKTIKYDGKTLNVKPEYIKTKRNWLGRIKDRYLIWDLSVPDLEKDNPVDPVGIEKFDPQDQYAAEEAYNKIHDPLTAKASASLISRPLMGGGSSKLWLWIILMVIISVVGILIAHFVLHKI